MGNERIHQIRHTHSFFRPDNFASGPTEILSISLSDNFLKMNKNNIPK